MQALPILNEHAGGIDVGSETLHVSIAGDLPQVFGTMTGDLHRLKTYLLEHAVRTVAVEATGVYWLCLYEVLEGAGIQVVVVNGRHVKNVPGRKTDMADCNGWPLCMLTDCCAPASCPRRTSAACRITCGCARRRSPWRPATCSICSRPWSA